MYRKFHRKGTKSSILWSDFDSSDPEPEKNKAKQLRNVMKNNDEFWADYQVNVRVYKRQTVVSGYLE